MKTKKTNSARAPWNKGRLSGQKPPLKRPEIWAIRVQLQLENRTRERALFDLAIDSKLRACDLISLRVADITLGGSVARRACVQQRKTGRPVQFEITPQTRQTVSAWIAAASLGSSQYLFPSRCHDCTHLSTRQ